MFKFYCPAVEAIMYYTNAINGDRVKEVAGELCESNPSIADSLYPVMEPALQLEREIDAQVNLESSRLDFFFSIDLTSGGEHHLTGTAACLLLVHSNRINEAPTGLNELCAYRKSLSMRQRIRVFASAIHEITGEIYAKVDNADEIGFIEFMRSLSIAPSLRRKLLDLYANFETYIDELASLLKPVVDIIESRRELYAEQLDKLEAMLCDMDKLPAYLLERFNCEVPPGVSFIIYPCLLKPNKLCVHTNLSASTDIIIGVGLKEISARLYSLCDSRRLSTGFKTLSDEMRLDILRCVCMRPVYGLEIGDIFSISPPAVSYHINKLVVSGFVDNSIKGGKTYYRPNYEKIDEFIELFRRFLKTPYIMPGSNDEPS